MARTLGSRALEIALQAGVPYRLQNTDVSPSRSAPVGRIIPSTAKSVGPGIQSYSAEGHSKIKHSLPSWQAHVPPGKLAAASPPSIAGVSNLTNGRAANQQQRLTSPGIPTWTNRDYPRSVVNHPARGDPGNAAQVTLDDRQESSSVQLVSSDDGKEAEESHGGSTGAWVGHSVQQPKSPLAIQGPKRTAEEQQSSPSRHSAPPTVTPRGVQIQRAGVKASKKSSQQGSEGSLPKGTGRGSGTLGKRAAAGAAVASPCNSAPSQLYPVGAKRRRCSLDERAAALLLQRYKPALVMALLREIARAAGLKLDWAEIRKRAAPAIGSQRECQAIWRHLAYCQRVEQSYQDEEMPLSDESDLEDELEAPLDSTASALQEAAACVEADMKRFGIHHLRPIQAPPLKRKSPGSSLPNEGGKAGASAAAVNHTQDEDGKVQSQTTGSTSARTAAFGVPPAVATSPRSWVSGENSMQDLLVDGQDSGKSGPASALLGRSISKHTREGEEEHDTSVEGEEGHSNAVPRKRKKGWSPAEDAVLARAVERLGEGPWVRLLAGPQAEILLEGRTCQQLAQRWAVLRRRTAAEAAAAAQAAQAAQMAGAAPPPQPAPAAPPVTGAVLSAPAPRIVQPGAAANPAPQLSAGFPPLHSQMYKASSPRASSAASPAPVVHTLPTAGPTITSLTGAGAGSSTVATRALVEGVTKPLVSAPGVSPRPVAAAPDISTLQQQPLVQSLRKQAPAAVQSPAALQPSQHSHYGGGGSSRGGIRAPLVTAHRAAVVPGPQPVGITRGPHGAGRAAAGPPNGLSRPTGPSVTARPGPGGGMRLASGSTQFSGGRLIAPGAVVMSAAEAQAASVGGIEMWQAAGHSVGRGLRPPNRILGGPDRLVQAAAMAAGARIAPASSIRTLGPPSGVLPAPAGGVSAQGGATRYNTPGEGPIVHYITTGAGGVRQLKVPPRTPPVGTVAKQPQRSRSPSAAMRVPPPSSHPLQPLAATGSGSSPGSAAAVSAFQDSGTGKQLAPKATLDSSGQSPKVQAEDASGRIGVQPLPDGACTPEPLQAQPGGASTAAEGPGSSVANLGADLTPEGGGPARGSEWCQPKSTTPGTRALPAIASHRSPLPVPSAHPTTLSPPLQQPEGAAPDAPPQDLKTSLLPNGHSADRGVPELCQNGWSGGAWSALTKDGTSTEVTEGKQEGQKPEGNN